MKKKEIILEGTPKGKKAKFFENPEMDYFFSIITILTQELSVTYDRLETLELLLEKNGLINRLDLETWKSNESEDNNSSKRREDLISRVFNIIHEEADLYKRK